MKNVKFRGKKTNSAVKDEYRGNSVAQNSAETQIPRFSADHGKLWALVISDISDHLPILTLVNIDLPRLEGSHKISREINGKNKA